MKKVITWVDLEGRYRVTSPAYNDPTSRPGETEDELLTRVWDRILARYGLPSNHPKYIVSDDVQRTAVADCAGHVYRWPVKVDVNNRRDGRDGAWEMGSGGIPRVTMIKARGIQMDYIRQVRDAELEKLDIPYTKALEAKDTPEQQRIAALKQQLRDIPQTFDLRTFATPNQLATAWPPELPRRGE